MKMPIYMDTSVYRRVFFSLISYGMHLFSRLFKSTVIGCIMTKKATIATIFCLEYESKGIFKYDISENGSR